MKAEKFYAVSYITYAYRKGHKENNWSLKASMQHVQGVRELLYISRKYSLEDLHWLMAKNFMESLCRRMDEGGVWLKLKLFFDVAWEIDWRCVHKRNLGKVPQLSFGKIFCRGILIPEIRKAIDSLQYIAKRVSSIINRLLES